MCMLFCSVMITVGWSGPSSEKDSWFTGSITRALLYGKELTAAERTRLSNFNDDSVSNGALVLDWDGYALTGAVRRVLNSRLCSGTNCQQSGGMSSHIIYCVI